MPERHKVVPAALFVLESDGHYLFQLRRNTGHLDNMWSMPGGHAEAGEHILQTAVREAREELGITVEQDDLQLIAIHNYRRPDGQDGLNFYYKLTRWEGEPTNTDPAHAETLQWFPINKLPENINPEFHEVIEAKPAHLAIAGRFQPRLNRSNKVA